jgi:hypothetical protein
LPFLSLSTPPNLRAALYIDTCTISTMKPTVLTLFISLLAATSASAAFERRVRRSDAGLAVRQPTIADTEVDLRLRDFEQTEYKPKLVVRRRKSGWRQKQSGRFLWAR